MNERSTNSSKPGQILTLYGIIYILSDKAASVMATNEQSNDGLNSLAPIETATNPYDAIGSWWGRAVLRHALNNGAGDRLSPELTGLVADTSVARRSGVEENIGGFARALAGLLIETNGRAVRV